MADYLTTDTELTSIADAIRTKGGTSAQLVYPTGFVSAIEAISTGGGASKIFTVNLVNPVNPSYAQNPACIIYESDNPYYDPGDVNQIGQIVLPDGSATVTVTKPIVITKFFTNGYLSRGSTINEHGSMPINPSYVEESTHAFYVYEDGSADIIQVDYDD